MTNTKFRKRALLSSVAMLIVALIALGSATFAWYESNPSVDATGMSFTTSAASGLQVTTATVLNSGTYIDAATASNMSAATTDMWGTTAAFGAPDKSVQPASFNPSTHLFYTASGTSAINGAIKDVSTIQTSTDYVVEEAYFKIGNGTTASGDVYLTSVTFPTAPATDMAANVRIVVVGNDGTNDVYYEFGNIDTTQTASASYLDITGTTKSVQSDKTVYKKGACDFKVATATKTGNVANKVRVYAYLDGFDATNVTSSKAIAIGGTASAILKGIDLQFTLKNPVAETPGSGS